MISKSLKQALEDAEAEAPAGGGGGQEWESGEYDVEVVTSNVNRNFGAPRIGIQVQRSEDGRRRWFDLYFDEANPKGYAQTGRKLKALGLNPTLEALDNQFPQDGDSQLDALAPIMVGIKARFKVTKQEKTRNVVPGAEPKFINYFDVVSLIAGPNTPSSASAPTAGGGLAGLMG